MKVAYLLTKNVLSDDSASTWNAHIERAKLQNKFRATHFCHQELQLDLNYLTFSMKLQRNNGNEIQKIILQTPNGNELMGESIEFKFPFQKKFL